MESTKEREISLSKLFWKLMLGWRRWMAVGIVFAIILPIALYMDARTAYQEKYKEFQMQQQGEDAEEIEEVEEVKVPLTREEMDAVEDVRVLQKQITRVREYIEDSVLMKLKQDSLYALVLQYYVDSDYTYNYVGENTPDYTSAITTNYRNYILSGVVAKEIKEGLGLDIEERYINELISVEATGNTFKIKVIYGDTETLEQMETIITNAVEGKISDLNKTIGSHRLKLIDVSVSSESDPGISTKQKTQSDMVYSYTTQLNALKNALSEAQLEALGIKIEEEKEEEGVEEEEFIELLPEPIPPTFNVIYLVLGFVVGAFLACIWILLEVLFAVKVQDSEEISSIYGLRSFGEITGQQEKKKSFSFVDDFILKLQNRNKKQLNKEQQIRMICSNLELACQKSSVDKVYFTGSEIEKMNQAVLAEIKKGLSSIGIQVSSGENISYDAKSLKQMAEIGCVVFVEQVGLSIYKEIEKEIKIARENSIDILGSIVIV